MEGEVIRYNMVLLRVLPHLICISNYHFNVIHFNLWYFLCILHQHFNPLFLCCCIRLLFMCHISLYFNIHLLSYTMIPFFLSNLVHTSLIYPLHYYLLYIICSDMFALIHFLQSSMLDLIWYEKLKYYHSDLLWSNLI